ncbi:MAG: translocation/assembly module TamB domain-containing protein [Desulfuromonadales bacterium]|nr:translocation/assembly module TamB domain-containing protein [Desulfuromonadales bacterium]
MVRGLTTTFMVFCLLAGLVFGAAIWLLYTTAGADFALRRLAQQLDTQITLSQLSGSLARGLSITDLAIEQAEVSLQARSIQLDMAVSSLYPFHLTLSTLALADATLVLPQTESSRQQPGLHLQIPQLPATLDLLQVDIAQLDLNNISIVQGDDIRVVEELNAAIDFHQRRLSISDFNLRIDDLSVAAALTLDMADATGDLTATVENSDGDQLWRKIVVESSLAVVAADSSAGKINLQLYLVDHQPFSLQADITLGVNRLTFTELLFHQAKRSGSVAAAGQLRFGDDGPALSANIFPQDLDLSQEAGLALVVNGEIALSYAQMQYQGELDLTTRGDELVAAALTTDFSGDHQHLRLQQINASWLAAQISGNIDLDWLETLKLAAQLQIEHLSLEPFLPDSNGLLNANLAASYRHDEQSPQAHINIELYDSTLYEYPLSGVIAADYKNDNLILHQLNLLSHSAQLRAQGDLHSNIEFTLTLHQLADFYPPAAGVLTAQGWLNHGADGRTADVRLAGSELLYDEWQLSSFDSHFSLDTDQQFTAVAQFHQLGSTTQQLLVDEMTLLVAGTPLKHQIGISARAQETTMKTSLQASWSESLWTALLQHLEVNTLGSHWRLSDPAAIVIGSQIVRVSNLHLGDGAQQSVRLQGEYLPVEESLSIDLDWSELSLNLLGPWLDPALLQGDTGGTLSVLQQPDNTEIHLVAHVNADLHYQQIHLQDISTRLTVNWGADGLAGDLLFDIGSPAHLLLEFHSPDPADMVLPELTTMSLTCRQIPLQLIQSWLPAEMIAQGVFACDMQGWWSAENQFALHGNADISAGSFYWHDDEQAMDLALDKVTADWSWEGDALRARTAIVHDFGHINGSLDIALPARLPFSLTTATTMVADVDFQLRESGLLSVFFPSYVYDSKGEIELTATINGSFGEPLFAGSFSLKDAQLYVPAAGIRIADIMVAAQLEGQQLDVSTLQLSSGQGSINGRGRVEWRGWVPDNYRFSIGGDNFQLINLTDLALQVSPDLVIDGSLEKVRVRGSLQFPQVMIKDQTSSRAVQNSPDLVIMDRQAPGRKTIEIRHDIDINLILGEQVMLNFAGLQARVAGSLRLYTDAQQDIAAQGRLFVERGRFSSYGVSLDIERGDLYFAGVPLRYPTLDILAIRRAGEVRAGVRVTGTPQEPQVSLYSDPVMPDADILSYVVFGRPLDSSGGGDTDLLMLATGALLSQGESIILQERLKGRFGLDVLEFSAGDGDTNGSLITTGKYITPDLYVSLGYSLFNNTNEIRMRYRLSSRLELESSFGQESGVDLFYRLERDRLFKK